MHLENIKFATLNNRPFSFFPKKGTWLHEHKIFSNTIENKTNRSCEEQLKNESYSS